jgi:hypothetical protein
VKATRNRRLVLFLLPAMLFLWMIGWSLYTAGSKRASSAKKQVRRRTEKTVEITVNLPQQQEIPQ